MANPFSYRANMLYTLPVLAALAATATASYDDNINFKSPSFDHPSMGIDMPRMMKRHLYKRDYNVTIDPNILNFTYGVASVSVCTKKASIVLTGVHREIHTLTR